MSTDPFPLPSLRQFHAALEADREYLNSRFRNSSRPGSFNGNDFLQEFADLAGPLVELVALEAPERTRQATRGLFDSLLGLHVSGHLGPQPKLARLRDLWQSCLPRARRLLVSDAYQVSGALSNGLIRVAQHSTNSAERWLTLMETAVPQVESMTQLLDVGLVAAWFSGLAPFRKEALRKLAELPFAISRTLLRWETEGTPTLLSQLLQSWVADPWVRPLPQIPSPRNYSLMKVGQVGSFRGFDGPFLYPPMVVAESNQLIAISGDSAWRILGDCFGSAAIQTTRVPRKAFLTPDQTSECVKLSRAGLIQWGDLQTLDASLAGASSYACDGTTLAITLPTSFHVYLVARCES